MVIATVLSAIATGTGVYYSSKQYKAAAEQVAAAREQLTAGDRNLTFQHVFEALMAMCTTTRKVDIFSYDTSILDGPAPWWQLIPISAAEKAYSERGELVGLKEQADVFRDKLLIYALWAPDEQREDILNGADDIADDFGRMSNTTGGEPNTTTVEQFAKRQAKNLHFCREAPSQLISWFKTGKEPDLSRKHFEVVPQSEIDEFLSKLPDTDQSQ